MESSTTTFSNEFANLSLHKSALNGLVQDYMISFNEIVTELEFIFAMTHELVKRLFEHFQDKIVKANLKMKVRFLNTKGEVYHHNFLSYQAETVWGAEEFFERHLLKMRSCLERFNEYGNNLLIDGIEHITIALSIRNKTSS